MNLLKNLKVKTKLITAFLIVAVLVAIVGGIGSTSLKNVAEESEKMYSYNLQSVYILTDMKQNLTEIKACMLQLVYEKDPSKKANLEKVIQENKDESNKYIVDFEKIPTTQEEREIYANFKGELDEYRTLRENVIKFVDENNYVEAEKQYKEIPKVRDAMFDSLSKIIEINLNNADKANSNIQSIYVRSNILMITLNITGFIIAILLGLVIAKNVNKPLQNIKDFAERLVSYDFSDAIEVTSKDEFGQTSFALNTAQDNVSNLIRAIMENAQDMSASSEELSATVEELLSKSVTIDNAINNIASSIQENSAASEEISASVEEVDSSINELSQKTMEGSNNAIESKERATEVKNNGQKAIEQIQKIYLEKQDKMLKAIEDGKVVENIEIMADTIASIAEQTNLLALNAAIEAARAGEHGKGFAVVAEEVRKLAEQSSHAVASIKDTIAKVQGAFKSSIDNGSEILEFINKDVHAQFNAYGETGNKYYDDSDFVSKMSEEIAAMSEEIAATVGQVSEAVQNMAGASQKSSEQTETIKESIGETTKAIDQVALTAQNQAQAAEKLNEMVQKFKI